MDKLLKKIKKNKGTFLKGAIILALGGFLSKIIGAFYRLPLTNIIGGYGIGVYQMVFPFYSVLLTISSSGIPSAISKLIAEKNSHAEERVLLKSAFMIIPLLGLIGSVSMFFLSDIIANLQGNIDASLSYKLISPSVFLVSILAIYRGYFQGKMNMYPTAFSQIIEQIIKVAVGLVLALKFKDDIPLASGMVALAVTVSEIFACLYLFIHYLIYKKRKKVVEVVDAEIKHFKNKQEIKALIKASIPITLSSMLLPLTQMADSFLVINILSRFYSNSTSLYGLMSGGVYSVINMPVSLCYGISASILPVISRSMASGGSMDRVKKKSDMAIKLTLLVSIFSAFFIAKFSVEISNILFRNLSVEDRTIISRLLVLASSGIVFLAVMQTISGVLIGEGKFYIPVINLFIGCVVKIILSIILLNRQEIGIYGSAISTTVCYFVAGFLNLVYISRGTKIKSLLWYTIKGVLLSIVSLWLGGLTLNFLTGKVGFVIAMIICGLLYLILAILFKMVKLKESD